MRGLDEARKQVRTSRALSKNEIESVDLRQEVACHLFEDLVKISTAVRTLIQCTHGTSIREVHSPQASKWLLCIGTTNQSRRPHIPLTMNMWLPMMIFGFASMKA